MKRYYVFKTIIIICLLFCIKSMEVQGEVINFDDKNLEEAIREKINKPIVEITGDDVKNIEELLLYDKNIASLEGIQYLTNLKELNLMNNSVIDLTPLASLSNVRYLNLSYNNINDITPISDLYNLSTLFLSNNKIEDIKPLGKLNKLKILHLDDNKIKTIKGIKGAKNLESIGISYNNIDSIDELCYLTKLYSLNISDNNISDIKPLSGLSKLKYLDISNNNIKDIDPIRNLEDLSLTNMNLTGNPLEQYVFEDKLKEEFILSLLSSDIYGAIEEYYGEGRQYMNGGILSIEKLNGKYKIKIRVETFVGAHNPPYGIDTITISQDYTGIKIEDFTHEDEKIIDMS